MRDHVFDKKDNCWKTYHDVLYTPCMSTSPQLFGLIISQPVCGDVIYAMSIIDATYTECGYKVIPICTHAHDIRSQYRALSGLGEYPGAIRLKKQWHYDYGYFRETLMWAFIFRELCQKLSINIDLNACKWMLVWTWDY